MNKNKLIICLSAVLLTAALLVTAHMSFTHLGIHSLYFSDVRRESFVFNINYADCSGFSVNYVRDEPVYRGETAQNLDEYLLPHRIRIALSDCIVSRKMQEEYSAWEVYQVVINEHTIQFMWFYNNNHGITILLASDSVLSVNEQSFTKLNFPIGTISVNIGVSVKTNGDLR